MSKSILVTGSDGFIGSHLVESLVKKGNKVKAFCLYNSFNDIGWLKDLHSSILKNVEIFLGDIRDLDSIKKASNGVEYIFHLASLVAIPYSYSSPESYIDTNIKGTFNVLRAALDNNVSQVIHTSTSEVYGTAQFVPISETHPLVGQSPYSASKIGADQMAHSFYCSYGLPVSTVRPFNTYGARQSGRAVIPTIIQQALSNSTMLKLGNTKATRDFSYVTDTVEGMASFLDNAKTFGQTINLGTGVEVSIDDLVNIISELSRVNLKIELDEQRLRPEKSEVERLCSDITKAKNILHWHPKVDLRTGLALTLEWFRNRPHHERVSDLGYVI